MGTRSHPPAGRGHDSDRTDELPALDAKSFEGERASEPEVYERAEPVRLGGDLRAITDNIRSLETSLKARAEQIARLEHQLADTARELSGASVATANSRTLAGASRPNTRQPRSASPRSTASWQNVPTAVEPWSAICAHSRRNARTWRLPCRIARTPCVRSAPTWKRAVNRHALKGELAQRAQQVRGLEQERDTRDIEHLALDENLGARAARIAQIEAN